MIQFFGVQGSWEEIGDLLLLGLEGKLGEEEEVESALVLIVERFRCVVH